MTTRHRAISALNAVLYIGPLLAGLAGQGWNMVPLFACIFLLWLAVTQPPGWPRGRDEWRQRDRQVAIVAQSAVQILLVLVLFAVGRGLGGIMGVLPLWWGLMPAALSFAAVPLARLAGAIPVPAVPPEAMTGPRLQAAVRVTETLNGLPHDVPHDQIDAHMRAIAAEIGVSDLRDALLARAKGGEASATTMRALVNFASDPDWARSSDPAAAEAIFAAIGGNATLATHFATAMNRNVSADPDLAWHCPSAATMVERAQVLVGTDAEVPLRALAARVATITAPAAPAPAPAATPASAPLLPAATSNAA